MRQQYPQAAQQMQQQAAASAAAAAAAAARSAAASSPAGPQQQVADSHLVERCHQTFTRVWLSIKTGLISTNLNF